MKFLLDAYVSRYIDNIPMTYVSGSYAYDIYRIITKT